MLRLRVVAGFLGVILLAVALRLGLAQHIPMICPLRRCTGIPCASCGLTRAAVALCQGQLAAASRQNLAAIPLAVAFFAWLFLLAWEVVTQRSVIRPLWKRYSGVLTWMAVGLMLAAWCINLHRHFRRQSRAMMPASVRTTITSDLGAFQTSPPP
jgi:hypothetical protein